MFLTRRKTELSSSAKEAKDKLNVARRKSTTCIEGMVELQLVFKEIIIG